VKLDNTKKTIDEMGQNIKDQKEILNKIEII